MFEFIIELIEKEREKYRKSVDSYRANLEKYSLVDFMPSSPERLSEKNVNYFTAMMVKFFATYDEIISPKCCVTLRFGNTGIAKYMWTAAVMVGYILHDHGDANFKNFTHNNILLYNGYIDKSLEIGGLFSKFRSNSLYDREFKRYLNRPAVEFFLDGYIENTELALEVINKEKKKLEHVKNARQFFNSKKYDLAVGEWSEASILIPLRSEEQLECSKAVNLLDVVTRRDVCVEDAKKFFELKRYALAVEKWNEAAKLAPLENEDLDYKKAINILEERDDCIKSAKDFFELKKYTLSIQKWDEAASLMPLSEQETIEYNEALVLFDKRSECVSKAKKFFELQQYGLAVHRWNEAGSIESLGENELIDYNNAVGILQKKSEHVKGAREFFESKKYMLALEKWAEATALMPLSDHENLEHSKVALVVKQRDECVKNAKESSSLKKYALSEKYWAEAANLMPLDKAQEYEYAIVLYKTKEKVYCERSRIILEKLLETSSDKNILFFPYHYFKLSSSFIIAKLDSDGAGIRKIIQEISSLLDKVTKDEKLKYKFIHFRAKAITHQGNLSEINRQRKEFWSKAVDDYNLILRFDPEFSKNKAAAECDKLEKEIIALELSIRNTNPMLHQKNPDRNDLGFISPQENKGSVSINAPSFSLIPYNDIQFGSRVLGEGGFGTVRQAKWQHIDVAVKQLKLGRMSDKALDEFQQEAANHGALRHPNIVALYGACLEHGKYCMVMELMIKGSLYDLLHNNEDLPWNLRLSIAKDICIGLAYLHAKNIVHRDMKSLNVLLDDRGRAKLSDFGLSTIKSETSSTSSAVSSVGTLCWMAPELFKRGGKCTPASDVYAMGIVFWELTSRKLPFADAPNQTLVTKWVSEGEREEIPAETPKKFAALIAQCWKERTEERPVADQVLVALTSESDKAATPAKTGYQAFTQ